MNPLAYLKTVSVAFALLAMGGCATGDRALQKGQYHKATRQATKHLGNYPNSDRAANTLVTAYPEAKIKWLDQASYATESADPYRWEVAVEAYTRLNELASRIDSTPATRSLNVEYEFYNEELFAAKRMASEAREEMGDALLASGQRHDARSAYFHYEKALEFALSERALASKQAQALETGTVTFALYPIRSHAFGLDPIALEEEVLRRVDGRSIGMFVRMVPYYDDYGSSDFLPDHVLTVSVRRSNIGDESRSSSRRSYQKKIKIGETKDDPPKPIYKKIEANVVEYHLSKYSHASVEFSISDSTNGIPLYSKNAFGSASWSDTWYRVSGDARAAPSHCSKSSYSSSPSDRQQESEVIRQVARDIKRGLDRFYESY